MNIFIDFIRLKYWEGNYIYIAYLYIEEIKTCKVKKVRAKAGCPCRFVISVGSMKVAYIICESIRVLYAK